MRSYDIQNVNIPFMRHLMFLWGWPRISLCGVISTASDGRTFGACSGAGFAGSGLPAATIRGCSTQTLLSSWG